MSRDHRKLKACDYAHFVTIALGSASEVRYLLSVARRLTMLESEVTSSLETRYDELVRGLQGLVSALDKERDER